MTFQEMILTLQRFWAERGCLIVQPYNSEVGAGTYNPATFLRAIGPEPWNVAFVEPSRRPTDGRYGDNPNRLQQFHQYQVILKPAPIDIQIIGRNIDANRAFAVKLLERLRQVPGIADLRIQQPFDQPRLDVVVDRTKAQQAGFTQREVAGVLQRYPRTTIEIVGHTDSVGNEDMNQDLSDRRAASVRDSLTRFGVSPTRIVTRGAGELRPLADNSTPEGRARNRRVDLTVRPDSGLAQEASQVPAGSEPH